MHEIVEYLVYVPSGDSVTVKMRGTSTLKSLILSVRERHNLPDNVQFVWDGLVLEPHYVPFGIGMLTNSIIVCSLN